MSFSKSLVFAGIFFLMGCRDQGSEISSYEPTLVCREDLRVCEKARIDVVTEISELNTHNGGIWTVGILQSYGPEVLNTSEIKRIVVLFHGGPRVPFVNSGLLEDMIEVFGDENTLIASVAYSATELPNFHGNRRLRRHHLNAVEQDALLVADYVRSLQSIHGIDHVFVVGGSFGAIPALRLASVLGEDLDGLILASPWLFPLPIDRVIDSPISYVSSSMVLPSPDDREMLREDITELYREYLGLSDEMNGSSSGERHLEKIRAASCDGIQSKAIVFIVQHEDRANVQLTREYFERCAGLNSVMDVRPAFHGMELSFPWVRQEMRDFAER